MRKPIKRVVITGTVGVGKTTFIRTITKNRFVDTERLATDLTKILKPKTTVGMDFGRVQIKHDRILHLYGTPGQSRFDFMWDLLISTAHAYVLLVSANSPHELNNARKILNFMNQKVKIPMMFGLTNCQAPDALNEKEIAMSLGRENLNKETLFVSVNPQEFTSVQNILNILVSQVMSKNETQFISADSKYNNQNKVISPTRYHRKNKVIAAGSAEYTPLFQGLKI